MFWELIATFSAGLGAAGIALLLRGVRKTLPKMLVPAAAGLGMLAFQIYSEYTWFDHTRARLPDGTQVLAAYPQPAWYKPWSYVWPPLLRFATVDGNDNRAFRGDSALRQSTLYFFARREAVRHWPIVIDCVTKKQANLPAGEDAPDWQSGTHSAALAAALCEP